MTRRGNCGRQTTKKIAKGLKIRQAPIHAMNSHAGKNATCSNIITSLSTVSELHGFTANREVIAQTNIYKLYDPWTCFIITVESVGLLKPAPGPRAVTNAT